MKTLVFFLMIVSSAVCAQNVDYNKIILPSNAQGLDFAEKLVQIAWRNNPENAYFIHQERATSYDVKKSAVDWLNYVTFQSNLNEFVLNPAADQFARGAFYPKYNVNFSVALGSLFTIPYTTKQSKERQIMAQSQVNSQKLLIRNQVLKAYNEYLMQEKVYKIQSQLALDNETSHKLTEQRFKSGEITFETYSTSLTNYSAVALAQVEAEKNFKNSKLDLEKLIGMRLEDVR